jgi:hypothetical protein
MQCVILGCEAHLVGQPLRDSSGSLRRASSRVSKYDIAADDPVHDVVERLLKVSGQWVVCAAVDRDETKRRMLEIVERVIGLLTS